ncbi:hypothetical protein MMC19_000128 [Ptychographa xylographoides]|nr:hypothetical protein [Ptychographa xylographoides]
MLKDNLGAESLLKLDTSPTPSSTSSEATPKKRSIYNTLAAYTKSESRNRATTASSSSSSSSFSPLQPSISQATTLAEANHSRDIERLQARRWRLGDVYAPHDLSPKEMKKWRDRGKPDKDVFDMLNLHPMDQYMNYSVMGEFMTTMGRIKHPRDTGLRRVNQRRIARAIRRGVGMGWIPSVHVHPEMLRRGMR